MKENWDAGADFRLPTASVVTGERQSLLSVRIRPMSMSNKALCMWYDRRPIGLIAAVGPTVTAAHILRD